MVTDDVLSSSGNLNLFWNTSLMGVSQSYLQHKIEGFMQHFLLCH